MNDQEQKCQCDFRIRMLGDGCRYCQPQEYIDRLHDNMDGMIHADCFELTEEEVIQLWNSIPLVPHQSMAERLKLFAKSIPREAQ